MINNNIVLNNTHIDKYTSNNKLNVLNIDNKLIVKDNIRHFNNYSNSESNSFKINHCRCLYDYQLEEAIFLNLIDYLFIFISIYKIIVIRKEGTLNKKILKWTNNFSIKFLVSFINSLIYSTIPMLFYNKLAFLGVIYLINSACWLLITILLYIEFRKSIISDFLGIRGYYILNCLVSYLRISLFALRIDNINLIENKAFLIIYIIYSIFSSILAYMSIFKNNSLINNKFNKNLYEVDFCVINSLSNVFSSSNSNNQLLIKNKYKSSMLDNTIDIKYNLKYKNKKKSIDKCKVKSLYFEDTHRYGYNQTYNLLSYSNSKNINLRNRNSSLKEFKKIKRINNRDINCNKNMNSYKISIKVSDTNVNSNYEEFYKDIISNLSILNENNYNIICSNYIAKVNIIVIIINRSNNKIHNKNYSNSRKFSLNLYESNSYNKDNNNNNNNNNVFEYNSLKSLNQLIVFNELITEKYQNNIKEYNNLLEEILDLNIIIDKFIKKLNVYYNKIWNNIENKVISKTVLSDEINFKESLLISEDNNKGNTKNELLTELIAINNEIINNTNKIYNKLSLKFYFFIDEIFKFINCCNPLSDFIKKASIIYRSDSSLDKNNNKINSIKQFKINKKHKLFCGFNINNQDKINKLKQSVVVDTYGCNNKQIIKNKTVKNINITNNKDIPKLDSLKHKDFKLISLNSFYTSNNNLFQNTINKLNNIIYGNKLNINCLSNTLHFILEMLCNNNNLRADINKISKIDYCIILNLTMYYNNNSNNICNISNTSVELNNIIEWDLEFNLTKLIQQYTLNFKMSSYYYYNIKKLNKIHNNIDSFYCYISSNYNVFKYICDKTFFTSMNNSYNSSFFKLFNFFKLKKANSIQNENNYIMNNIKNLKKDNYNLYINIKKIALIINKYLISINKQFNRLIKNIFMLNSIFIEYLDITKHISICSDILDIILYNYNNTNYNLKESINFFIKKSELLNNINSINLFSIYFNGLINVTVETSIIKSSYNIKRLNNLLNKNTLEKKTNYKELSCNKINSNINTCKSSINLNEINNLSKFNTDSNNGKSIESSDIMTINNNSNYFKSNAFANNIEVIFILKLNIGCYSINKNKEKKVYINIRNLLNIIKELSQLNIKKNLNELLNIFIKLTVLLFEELNNYYKFILSNSQSYQDNINNELIKYNFTLDIKSKEDLSYNNIKQFNLNKPNKSIDKINSYISKNDVHAICIQITKIIEKLYNSNNYEVLYLKELRDILQIENIFLFLNDINKSDYIYFLNKINHIKINNGKTKSFDASALSYKNKSIKVISKNINDNNINLIEYLKQRHSSIPCFKNKIELLKDIQIDTSNEIKNKQ